MSLFPCQSNRHRTSLLFAELRQKLGGLPGQYLTMFEHNRRLRFLNSYVYERLAAGYNALDWLTFGAWWRLVRRALDHIPAGQTVLEVGFGPGRLQQELARHAAFCAGIDLAHGMCRFTQRRLRRSALPIHITRGSVFDLPYGTDTFDYVVSTFAFSGFPDAPRAMAEMARVARPGGRVVLVDIGLPPDGNWLGVFLVGLWRRFGDYLYDMPQLMSDAGLVLESKAAFGPGRHIWTVVGRKTNIDNRAAPPWQKGDRDDPD